VSIAWGSTPATFGCLVARGTQRGRRLVVDEAMLREIVPREYTTAAVVRALGLEVSGPRHRAVNDPIARLGLDVSRFRGQGHPKGRGPSGTGRR
jgi:hypothetical protein